LCIKLVIWKSLYYDARSEKHQNMTLCINWKTKSWLGNIPDVWSTRYNFGLFLLCLCLSLMSSDIYWREFNKSWRLRQGAVRLKKLTLRGLCIVIYSYNEANEMHYFLYLFDEELHMFRTFPKPVEIFIKWCISLAFIIRRRLQNLTKFSNNTFYNLKLRFN
jgi:hypothetical protein